MESALLVEFPAADSVLDPWRRTFDQGRILGVPAHASVLFPFADPGDLTDADHARLTEIFGTFAPFEAVLTQPRWFGDEVLYLAPEPAATFAAMTAATHASWPQFPPYGGQFADVIPHVTVGDSGGREALSPAEAALRPDLPIRQWVDRVALYAGSDHPGSWHRVAEFRLRPPV